MLFTREQVTYDRSYHARTTINTEAVTLIETVYTLGPVSYLGTSEGTDCATISTSIQSILWEAAFSVDT